MPAYVALLRGINLGRNRRVAMADLRALLEGLGYADVRTHLQSGNAVFRAPARSGAAVEREVEKAIASELDLDVRVIVRTSAELARIVAADPLGEQATDPSRAMVLFCEKKVPAAKAAALSAADVGPDALVVDGREIYLWLPKGSQEATAPRVIEGTKLGLATTMRTWRTVTRLAEMAAALR